jgi:hypothetical protein
MRRKEKKIDNIFPTLFCFVLSCFFSENEDKKVFFIFQQLLFGKLFDKKLFDKKLFDKYLIK